MQRWEYCEVQLEITATLSSNIFRVKLLRYTAKGAELLKDLKKIPRESVYDAYAQLISQLGDEGWEMVGAGNATALPDAIYFKRPKP